MKFRSIVRSAIKTWARSGVSPGLCYRVIETSGADLGGETLQLTSVPGGALVECDLKDHVQRQIYYWGAYEIVETYVFANLLKPGMTFIDAGANIGQYSLVASRFVGPAGKVFAFEPIPMNFHHLQNSLARNQMKNVSLVSAALWTHRAELSMDRGEQHLDNAGTFRVTDKSSSHKVNAIDFDSWAEESKVTKIDAVKVDVEGAELAVLKGMERSLRRDHPFVIIEMQNEIEAAFGYSVTDIHTFLLNLGYRCWQISESPTERKWIERNEKWSAHNLLFHVGDLPPALMQPWNWKTTLRWARRS